MRKLDNKGFTVVELTLSFIFVFTIAFSMYELLFNYRVRQNEESIKSQMMDYKNEVTLAIQNDINEKTLKNIDYCKQGSNIIDRCLVLNFNDNTSKQLAVEDSVTEYDGNIYETNYISYGGIIYESSDALLLEYKPNYMLYNTYESDELEDDNIKVYRISIPIYHNDLEGDYGINIIAVGYDYSEPDVSVGSVEKVEASPTNPKKIAMYSSADKTLYFENISQTLSVGDTYNGKQVSYLYIGFDSYAFTKTAVPWYAVRSEVKNVVFNTTIAPTSTANWFNEFLVLENLDLSRLDTKNVTNMSNMFYETGMNAENLNLNLGPYFDTSKVTNMRYMFYRTGRNNTAFVLNLGDKFNTANVTDMEGMFWSTGLNTPNFKLDLGPNFDTSKVTNMSYMFRSSGMYSTTYTLNLGSKFNTASVTNMSNMFYNTGQKNPNFVLNLGAKFNTSQVTDMSNMFTNTAKESTTFTLNCSGWNVDNVTAYSEFSTGAGGTITPPTWKH